MDQLICINANYTPDQLKFWELHGVNYPKLDQLVTVREVIRHISGDTGIRTNEYMNPTVPIKSAVGVVNIEPSFHIKRFAHLNGDAVTKEEIREWKVAVKEREKSE